MAKVQLRIEGYVYDHQGEPIPGAKITLPEVGKQVTSREDGRYLFDEVGLEEGEYAIQCSPPEGYQSPENQSIKIEVGQEMIGGVDFRCTPATMQGEASMSKQNQSAGKPAGELDHETKESIRDDLNNLKGLTATLCATFTELRDHLDACFENQMRGSPTFIQLDEGFKKLAEKFVSNIREGLAKLGEDCAGAEKFRSKAEKLLRKDHLTAAKLRKAFGRYENQIRDMIIFYKGLNDLILIETSTRQMPPEFLNCIEPFLAKPFEIHNSIQKSAHALRSAIQSDPLELCQRRLAEQCGDLNAAVTTLINDLCKLAKVDGCPYDTVGISPPLSVTATVSAFITSLKDVSSNVYSQCQIINGLLTNSEHTIEKLGGVAGQLEAIQERVLQLLNALMEAVRTQQLPSWAEGADWLACAKQGIKDTWELIAAMLREVRHCLKKIEREKRTEREKKTTAITAASEDNLKECCRDIKKQLKAIAKSGSAVNLNQCCDELSSAVKDIATFIPTKAESTGGVGGGGGATGSFAAQRVSKVVAQLLGRPIGPIGGGGDPRSFMAALTGAFPEKDGQIVLEPVRAVVSLEVERGQLAASQGTLFREVQLIVNDALKVLEGLHSITFQTDKEKEEALKQIVRSEFSSLSGEAGRVDRPRKSRVDEIFAQLLGTGTSTPTDGSHLRRLRKELGLNIMGMGPNAMRDDLTNQDLVTSEEAQLIASMDLLDQYANTLVGSFTTFFGTLAGMDPSNGSFSGRLAFVSTLFSVVAASVREVEADMDAVELSQPERRTAFIFDPTVKVKGTFPFRISINSILSWVEDFASVEGPDLIAKSGLIGLNRVIGIVKDRLEPLVRELLEISKGAKGKPTANPTGSSPHPGLTHSRVRNALQQLDDQLKEFVNP